MLNNRYTLFSIICITQDYFEEEINTIIWLLYNYPLIEKNSEERNFIFHKKLTKELAIHCKIVLGTHRIWDEFYSTDI